MIFDPLNYALGAACLALALALGAQTWRLDAAQDALETERLDRAAERDLAKGAAIAALEDYRRREAADAARIKEAQDEGRKEAQRLERLVAVERAAGQRLRHDLAAYARPGGGDATGDSVEACRSRAAELAEAVADGLRVQEDMAGAFAALAVDYRVLHRSWPGQPQGVNQ